MAMMHLLSAEGQSRLRALVKEPALYAFDFDGTLARIVRERHAARLAPGVQRWLEALGRLVPTAVISGRSLSDLRTRLGLEVPYLVGNHGLEGADTPTQVVVQAREICADWKRQLQGILLSELSHVGVTIEDKGYSLTFHYRLSPNKPRARQLLFEVVGRLTPAPRLILGKAVVNAMPAGVPHKGDAVLALMRRAGVDRALYVGDDDTDEDVFALPDERILTVRVGLKQTSHARSYLRNQTEMSTLLAELVGLLGGEVPAEAVGSRSVS